MVNVQPFVFQRVTAFKERLQLANKINEMIAVLNNTMDPEEVLAIVRAELVNYYTKEEVDELIAGIDFSPYYTKTEVDTIVDRIDDDVDAVEGRVTTAEGDIDNLESNKQNVLTPVSPISIQNDTISLKGFTEVTDTDWSNLGSAVYENGNWTITFNHDTVFGIFSHSYSYNPAVAFTRFEKGSYVCPAGGGATESKRPYIYLNGVSEDVYNTNGIKGSGPATCAVDATRLFTDNSATSIGLITIYKSGMFENPTKSYNYNGRSVTYTELSTMMMSTVTVTAMKNVVSSGNLTIKAYVRD